jgi:hypothetical protein
MEQALFAVKRNIGGMSIYSWLFVILYRRFREASSPSSESLKDSFECYKGYHVDWYCPDYNSVVNDDHNNASQQRESHRMSVGASPR